MKDPIQIAAEVVADGEGVRITVGTPSTTQTFIVPTDLVPQVCEMLAQRYRGAVAMRAALAPLPAPPTSVLPNGTAASGAEPCGG